MSLAIKLTGREIARLNEELKRMSARKDQQQDSLQDSSPQNHTPENDDQGHHENKFSNLGLHNPGNIFSKSDIHLNILAKMPFSNVGSNPSGSWQPVKFLPPGGFRPKFYIP